MTTGWLWHEIFNWHDTGTSGGYLRGPGLQPGAHVESAESKARFASLVEVSGLIEHLHRITPRPASEDELRRVHTAAYVENIQAKSRDVRGGDAGDGHSPFGQGGFEIARWASGSTLTAVEAVVRGEVTNAYALVRPPGHHAVADSGMGFCVFSNIGVAIAHARSELGINRVVVIDWDVHHGNGTEAIFDNCPEVLTISIHQDGNFPPDTGKIEHRGVGAGLGSAINIPFPAGAGFGAYEYAFSEVVEPAIRAFRPELIVVACGFDASNADPMGRMLLTSDAYARLTCSVMTIADEVCDGRLVFSHEGGYSPWYVPFCGLRVVETLSGIDTGIVDPYCEVWRELPGQSLQPHQRQLVDEVKAAIDASGPVGASALTTPGATDSLHVEQRR